MEVQILCSSLQATMMLNVLFVSSSDFRNEPLLDWGRSELFCRCFTAFRSSKVSMKGEKATTRRRGNDLLPLASSASCLGIISTAGARREGEREGRGERDETGELMKILSCSVSFVMVIR